jgi:histone H3/H4
MLRNSFQLDLHVQKTLLVQLFKNFDAIRCSSFDCLIDVLQRFLREVGVEAAANAATAGRSEINTIDVLSALQLLDSQLFQIVGYGNLLEEPFLTRLPKSFEIRRRPKVPKSFQNIGTHRPSYVPGHFPVFPDEHTFRGQSADVKERKSKHFMGVRNLNIRKIERSCIFPLSESGLKFHALRDKSRKLNTKGRAFDFYHSHLDYSPAAKTVSVHKENRELSQLISGKTPFDEVTPAEDIQ